MQLTNLNQHKVVSAILLISIVTGLYIAEELLLSYVGVMCALFMALPICRKDVIPQNIFLCLAFSVFMLIIGNAFQEIYYNNPMLIAIAIVSTYTCDAFAYIIGRFFGKNKLIERISPKKTIEGSIGGWIFGFLSTILFWKLLMPEMNPFVMILSAILMPIFGQMGDLTFSAVKREYSIKDYGNLLPGHGGILDRIDSLSFNLIFLYFLISVI